MKCTRFLSAMSILILTVFIGYLPAETVTPLRSRGYSLIPAPRQVELREGEVVVDRSWEAVTEGAGSEFARESLCRGLAGLHGLTVTGGGGGRVVLKIDPRSVTQGPNESTRQQAYSLLIEDGRVTVSGNAQAGLFYGVQSLLQLLKTAPGGVWTLPAGRITDWPELPLRFVHWDTKHHQNRIETLKRYLDWAALFKVNLIGFEMEDKYEYPSHPVIGAPGAYTKSQMQELTRYALERHIQLVPQIQSPAHMAYVLKHPEFAHLRADGSNYQACMCDEEALRLIFDMYQDMIEATPGVDYFHVSTDEVYFAGICDKCQKKRPFNDENRSLTWVEYVNRAFAWLAERHRRMLCWVEYPVLERHLHLLPAGLINGVASTGDSWVREIDKAGIDQLIYNSQQGGELLFPNCLSSETTYRGRPLTGRVSEAAQTVRAALGRKTRAIGTYAAAWDDSGLHDETFWLGWATVTQYGWSPEAPSVEQSVADFMDVYYGPGNQDLIEVYRTLMEGARFYEDAWDRVPATRLKPSYGSWARKGRDTTRIDLTLEPPQLPFSYDMTLVVEDNFSRKYARQLEQAPQMLARLDRLIHQLEGKLGSDIRNRYNLEVLISIARLESHFCSMLLELREVERLLFEASALLDQGREDEVVARLVQAQRRVAGILADRARMWEELVATWEKSRFPKGRSVDGRQFVHVLDDLKDHRADRRPGLDYMLEPFENIGLEDWNRRFGAYIQSFAAGTGLPVPDLTY